MAPEDLSQLRIDKPTPGSARKSRSRMYLIVLILVVGVGLGYLYRTGALRPATTVEAVTVSRINPSQTLTVLNASGYVVAQRKAAVASKVTGRLVSLTVEEGSRVSRGDIIARLENADVTAGRDQAEANLLMARANLDQARVEWRDAELNFTRHAALVDKGVVARSAFDTAEARYRRAQGAVASCEAAVRVGQAVLEASHAAVDYTLIRAPFDAVVLTKNADIGDIVTPLGAAANAKAAVVTIADLDSLRVEADVSESSLSQVRDGQPCEILLDAIPDKRFRGVVHRIVPTADRTKATILVKVRFLDKDLRILPEMSAKVAFLSRSLTPQDQIQRKAVQRDALATRKDGTVVFLIAGGEVRETPVQTGMALGELIEIREGLQVGDKVVLKPPTHLQTGSRITLADR